MKKEKKGDLLLILFTYISHHRIDVNNTDKLGGDISHPSFFFVFNHNGLPIKKLTHKNYRAIYIAH